MLEAAWGEGTVAKGMRSGGFVWYFFHEGPRSARRSKATDVTNRHERGYAVGCCARWRGEKRFAEDVVLRKRLDRLGLWRGWRRKLTKNRVLSGSRRGPAGSAGGPGGVRRVKFDAMQGKHGPPFKELSSR